MNDKIRELQEEILKERNKISNCEHQWEKAISNPEIKKKPYGSKIVGQGSDVWNEPIGYSDVTIPRWTRKCSLCGKEQHSYKQKPIIDSYEPDFDSK